MAVRRARASFRVDERVLCFEPDPSKARVLYEAKILEVHVRRNKNGTRAPEYLIHFNGWSSTWDRRLGEEHLLKLTPEHSALAKRLREVARGIRTNNARKRKIGEVLDQVLKKGKRRNLEHACMQRGSNPVAETGSRSSGTGGSNTDDDEGTLSADDDESCAASPGCGRSSDHSDAGSNGRIESADGTNSDDSDNDDDATTTSSKRQTNGRQRRQHQLPHGQRSRPEPHAGGCRRKSAGRNGGQVSSENDESRDSEEEGEGDEDSEEEQSVLYTGPPESAPRLELPLSPNLRKVLAADYHHVRRTATKRQQATVPVRPSVLAILEIFLDDFARHAIPVPPTEVTVQPSLAATKASSVAAVRDPLPPCAEARLKLAEEVAEGIRVLFDCTLPLILLYAGERQEYEDLFVACTAGRNDVAATANDSKDQCVSPSLSQVDADVEPEAAAATASTASGSLIGRLTRPPISTCTAAAAAAAAVPVPVPATPSSPRQCKPPGATFEARALRHSSLRSHGSITTPNCAVATAVLATESCNSNKDHVHDLLRRTRPEVNHVHRSTTDSGDCGADNQHAYEDGRGLGAWQAAASGAAHTPPDPPQQHQAQQQQQNQLLAGVHLLPSQYHSAKPPLPCTVYGLPHLLRLLISLPELVSRMQITPEKCSTVQFILQKLVWYLSEHAASLQPIVVSQHYD